MKYIHAHAHTHTHAHARTHVRMHTRYSMQAKLDGTILKRLKIEKNIVR